MCVCESENVLMCVDSPSEVVDSASVGFDLQINSENLYADKGECIWSVLLVGRRWYGAWD